MADVIIGSDELPLRVIKPHTFEKFDRHGQYCGIFTSGMKEHWRDPDGPPGSRLG